MLRPPTAVSADGFTHKRTPHAQRLSLARELSGEPDACQPFSLFSICCRYPSITGEIDINVLQQFTNCYLHAHYFLFLSLPCATMLTVRCYLLVQLAATARWNPHGYCSLSAAPSPHDKHTYSNAYCDCNKPPVDVQ